MAAIQLMLLIIVSLIVNCIGFKLPKESKENLILSDLLSDSDIVYDADNFGIEDDSFVSASKSLSKDSDLEDDDSEPQSIISIIARMKRAQDSDGKDTDESNSSRRASNDRSVSNKLSGKSEKRGSNKSSSSPSSSSSKGGNEKNSSGSSQSSKNDNKNSGKSEKNNSNQKSNSKSQSKDTEADEDGENNVVDLLSKRVKSKLRRLLKFPRRIKDLAHRFRNFIKGDEEEDDDDDGVNLFNGLGIIKRFKHLFQGLPF